jgi:hypothetical protein
LNNSKNRSSFGIKPNIIIPFLRMSPRSSIFFAAVLGYILVTIHYHRMRPEAQVNPPPKLPSAIRSCGRALPLRT